MKKKCERRGGGWWGEGGEREREDRLFENARLFDIGATVLIGSLS